MAYGKRSLLQEAEDRRYHRKQLACRIQTVAGAEECELVNMGSLRVGPSLLSTFQMIFTIKSYFGQGICSDALFHVQLEGAADLPVAVGAPADT